MRLDPRVEGKMSKERSKRSRHSIAQYTLGIGYDVIV